MPPFQLRFLSDHLSVKNDVITAILKTQTGLSALFIY